MAKKKYYVTFKIDGRFVTEVEAESVEKAIEEATYEYQDADFGKLEIIDGEAVCAEDPDGNFVFEK